MAVKHKILYLYLTLVCFLGIIVIFVFDGYMGLYDSLLMDNGQYMQTVEADQWSQQEKRGYLASTNVERDGVVNFTYEVDNRLFSEYTSNVEISMWHNQEKLSFLAFETWTIASFSKGELKWSLDAAEIVPADFSAEQSYNVSVVIKRGEFERKVVININPSPYPPKPVIMEAPR